MADLDYEKKIKKKIAQLLRMLSSAGGERRNAWAALERLMQSEGIGWSDIGNMIEPGAECNDGKFSEAELQQFGQAMRAEGVEAGIKIGMARGNGGGHGHLTLPKPAEMAEYCRNRLGQLKDDKQREFVSDMHEIAQRGSMLSRGRLGYLASIYIQIGGRI
ncbi:MAG: hypothetical protein ACLQJR_19135 [Stellaceae bacterium]